MRKKSSTASGLHVADVWAQPIRVGVRAYLNQSRMVLDQVDETQLGACLEALYEAWEADRTVFTIGNGGSASTASRMACDLTKHTQVVGRHSLRAHSLTDNVELLTSIANDIDYAHVFAEQLRIHARPGDVLICISGSGNSLNVIAAMREARRLALKIIGFGGFDGGQMRTLCDLYVHVPSQDYGHIESTHIIFDHCLTSLLLDYARAVTESRTAVLVDRDGVITRNREDYVKNWDEVQLLPGAIEALARLHRAGYRVFVVTNQSAIGRGLASQLDVDEIHDRIASLVARDGGHIEAFLVCPHTPEDACPCRKPAPGLLHQARDRFGVVLAKAYVVGDHDTDVLAAKAAGCSSILVLSGRSKGNGEVAAADNVVEDIVAAADWLLSGAVEPCTLAEATNVL